MPLLPAHQRRAWHLALLVASVYAASGCAWILLSDAAVRGMSTDPDWLIVAQQGKGLAYVALTTGLLLVGVLAGTRRLLQAVQQGADSALRVQDLFDNHPQPMWYYDRHTLRFLRVNDAALALYGFSRAEFLAMVVTDLRPPAERDALARRLRERAPATVSIVRVTHQRRSGMPVQVQVSARDASHDGHPAVLVLAVDISDQVAAQQALQRQETLLRELHQSLAEVLWVASPDGSEILYVSPALESVYGVPAEAFRADPSLWTAMVHPEDRAVALASAQAVQQHGSAECQYRICRPDGAVRWLSDRKKRVHDAQGRLTMIAGIAEDITERRVDQDMLRRNAAELAERYAELARFNRAAVDRELDMIALKREINALAAQQRLPPPHALGFVDTFPGGMPARA